MAPSTMSVVMERGLASSPGRATDRSDCKVTDRLAAGKSRPQCRRTFLCGCCSTKESVEHRTLYALGNAAAYGGGGGAFADSGTRARRARPALSEAENASAARAPRRGAAASMDRLGQ